MSIFTNDVSYVITIFEIGKINFCLNNPALDNRTKGEVEAGKIHAKYWLNIPSTDVKAAFDLNPNQFQQQFQLTKPSKDDKIILYCMRGNRSADAANQLEALGYNNVFNYSDGWVDWTGWGSDLDCDAWKNWKLKVESFDYHNLYYEQ